MNRKRLYFLSEEKLQVGDIILVNHRIGLLDRIKGWLIRKASRGNYSHAEIYIGNGRLFESTSPYSFTKNIQREGVVEPSDFLVLRDKTELDAYGKDLLVNFLLTTKVGEHYSSVDAITSVCGVLGEFFRALISLVMPFSLRSHLFCSYLVAQAYDKIELTFCENLSKCTPGTIEKSELLIEVPNVSHIGSDEEMCVFKIKDKVKCSMRKLARFLCCCRIVACFSRFRIQNLNDVYSFLLENPQKDGVISMFLWCSGYNNVFNSDLKDNPCRYFSGSLLKTFPDEKERIKFIYWEMSVLFFNVDRFSKELLAWQQEYVTHDFKYVKMQIDLYSRMLKQLDLSINNYLQNLGKYGTPIMRKTLLEMHKAIEQMAN